MNRGRLYIEYIVYNDNMIYITQLIYVKDGKEAVFHEFEDFAIPLMEQYKGKMIQRIRPDKKAFISGEADQPYEIHFLSFDSEEDLAAFMKDERRLEFLHLKEESVRGMLLVKGGEM